MPGYILMHAEVTDPDEYEQFKAAAAKAIEDHGGRYLVRGGLSTSLEGDFGSRVILVEFPSYQDALDFYHSEAYQAAREIRLRSAKAYLGHGRPASHLIARAGMGARTRPARTTVEQYDEMQPVRRRRTESSELQYAESAMVA